MTVDGSGNSDGTTMAIVRQFLGFDGANIAGMAQGPDGAIWFTDPGHNKIGRLTTSGALTEYAIPTANSSPDRITAAAGALWFTESNANKIGRIAISGTITEYDVPTPNGVTIYGDNGIAGPPPIPNTSGRSGGSPSFSLPAAWRDRLRAA